MEGQGRPHSQHADQMRQGTFASLKAHSLKVRMQGTRATPDPRRKGNGGTVASLVLAKTVLTPQDHFFQEFKPGLHCLATVCVSLALLTDSSLSSTPALPGPTLPSFPPFHLDSQRCPLTQDLIYYPNNLT